MQVRCADGVTLHVDPMPCKGRPRGAVVVLHAMMVDRRSMERPPGKGLCSTLSRAGWNVFNADFRGHGSSQALDDWTYDQLVRQDVPALVAAARAAVGGPVWVLGLSLGGHVALASVAEGACRVDGLCLMSTNVWLPSHEPSRRLRLAKHLAMQAMLQTTRAVGRFPSRAVGVGPADEAPSYAEDLCRFWFEDAWRARDGVDWGSLAQGVRAPVIAVAGSGDRLLARPVTAERFAYLVPGARFVEVGRGVCGLTVDPGHVQLGADPQCRGVWSWLAGWMAATRES